MSNKFDLLKRPTVPPSDQLELFDDLPPDWRQDWWGMPEFEMEDQMPQYRITINFMTKQDIREFSKKTGIPLTSRSHSGWFPHQHHLNGEFVYQGPKTDSRYPICIPSKGRADCQKTSHQLDKLGVSYKFFVEETEGDLYKQHLGIDRVVVMPFHDLGRGSIPARNFIWDWAQENNYKRHWVVDDNILHFQRTHLNRRISVRGGGFFRAMEDFVDRYENIALAGPHHKGFVCDRVPNLAPFNFNRRIYSCILIDTRLPYRWRGRYNEDTDLSLRILKDGYCTLLFHALIMGKAPTYYGTGRKSIALKGGNTDNVYNTDDYRLTFAKSLQEQHPDVVKVVWKYGRWHHQVDYSPFKNNKPILRSDVVPIAENNEYGMKLVRVK